MHRNKSVIFIIKIELWINQLNTHSVELTLHMYLKFIFCVLLNISRHLKNTWREVTNISRAGPLP